MEHDKMEKYYNLLKSFAAQQMKIPVDFWDIKKTGEEIDATFRKLNQFLIMKGFSESFRTIKSYPRIDVKNIAKEGAGGGLFLSIKKDFDNEELEDSKGFNNCFPTKQRGVIVNETENEGIYYKCYEVIQETDDTFGMDIIEYRFRKKLFYPHYFVHVEGLQKTGPQIPLITQSSDLFYFLTNAFSDEELNTIFSEQELTYIRIMSIPSIDLGNAIILETLWTFRVFNFLSEMYLNTNHHIEDNNYFRLVHWDNEEQTAKSVEENIIGKVRELQNGFMVLETHSLRDVICSLITEHVVENVYMAVGFAFLSGLKWLEKPFEKIHGQNGKTQLIIGSLQNYDNGRVNNRIDRNSVKGLNALLEKNLISLFTYNKSFYHGKFYYIGCRDKAYVIVGSSNISHTAFSDNVELDVIHVMERESPEEKMFLGWYQNLQDNCVEISHLDDSSFTDFNWSSELDAFSNIKNTRISKYEVQKKIDVLTDEELKYRLNIWISKNPSEIYDNLEIEALMGYVMFVYASDQIVVFESYVPGNAYYVFRYTGSLGVFLSNIATMSKTQMAFSEHYISRGYHIQNRERIERRISKYFT